MDLSDNLINKGLELGNTEVKGANNSSNDNMLIVYVIFNKAFADTLKLKAYDENGIEIGRNKTFISGNKDDAEYFSFVFNKQTNISSKSKIVIN